MTRDREARLKLLKRLAPFVGAEVLAWSVVLIGSSINWTEYAIATVLAFSSGLLTLVRVRSRRRAWLAVLPSTLVLLAALALLRNAAGGMTSGVGILALIPVFYVAMYSRYRASLVAVLAGVAVFYLAPILIVGAPRYPDSQYRSALLTLVLSSIIGFATQRLVRDVRHQAREARGRERMLQQVSDTVRRLYDCADVRRDLCEALKTISGATAAALYEPDPASGELRCLARTGFAAPDGEVVAAPASAVARVFASGQSDLVCENVEKHVGSAELWIAAGRPTALLFEPLVTDGGCVGVLAVAWPEAVRVEGSRATVVALLAHEAAAVIARADAMHDLSDEAQTDPLTGLPNRRGWDAALQRARPQNAALAVAMLDLDHFKEFNDTYGHPAGDELLRQTASAWRRQLRPDDVLARVGGDEFALLLAGDAGITIDVVERLREHAWEHSTCSAGIAIRIGDESTETLIARADAALYAAKAQGRNRISLSRGAVSHESAEPSLQLSHQPPSPRTLTAEGRVG